MSLLIFGRPYDWRDVSARQAVASRMQSAYPVEVRQQMARMHGAVFFIRPVFSKQASAPTKFGEFLGCGIPCQSNASAGDMARVLEEGVARYREVYAALDDA